MFGDNVMMLFVVLFKTFSFISAKAVVDNFELVETILNALSLVKSLVLF
jgi:hypothetical protein